MILKFSLKLSHLLSLIAFCVLAQSTLISSASEPIIGHYLESKSTRIWLGPTHKNGILQKTGPHNHRGDFVILGWSVEKGEWEGQNLKGLKVAAAIRVDGSLEFLNKSKLKSVLFIDKKANEKQSRALISLAHNLGKKYIHNVIDVRRTNIQFERRSLQETLAESEGATHAQPAHDHGHDHDHAHEHEHEHEEADHDEDGDHDEAGHDEADHDEDGDPAKHVETPSLASTSLASKKPSLSSLLDKKTRKKLEAALGAFAEEIRSGVFKSGEEEPPYEEIVLFQIEKAYQMVAVEYHEHSKCACSKNPQSKVKPLAPVAESTHTLPIKNHFKTKSFELNAIKPAHTHTMVGKFKL